MANNYDPYIRKPYELYIATAWFVATATSFAGYIVLPGGNSMMIPWLCFGFMAIQSAFKGLNIVGRGKVGEMLTFMDVGKLLELVKPEKMWFGWGFDWLPESLRKADLADTCLILKSLLRRAKRRNI